MFLLQQSFKQKSTREGVKKTLDLMRALISFGCSVTAAAKGSGDTALHVAARIKSDSDAQVVFSELAEVAGLAALEFANAAGETPASLAKQRPRRALDPILRREKLKGRLPSATGFFAPWCQIFSGAWLTASFGWLMGCALFAASCTLFSGLSGITKAAERRVQHGFAVGSVFFIVASGYFYLLDIVRT